MRLIGLALLALAASPAAAADLVVVNSLEAPVQWRIDDGPPLVTPGGALAVMSLDAGKHKVVADFGGISTEQEIEFKDSQLVANGDRQQWCLAALSVGVPLVIPMQKRDCKKFNKPE